jgi:hypothetical protein
MATIRKAYRFAFEPSPRLGRRAAGKVKDP